MSGIYIPSMEMPESCGKCYMFSFLSDSCGLTNHVTEEMDDKMFDRRFEDCPLLFVPDHGRLCSKDDALKVIDNLIGRIACGTAHDALRWAKDCLSVLPTIIPADKDAQPLIGTDMHGGVKRDEQGNVIDWGIKGPPGDPGVKEVESHG